MSISKTTGTGKSRFKFRRKRVRAPVPFNCTASPCSDSSATAGSVYLYHVRAIYAGGGSSEFSNQDLASTAVFTDNSLNSNGKRTVTQARHFTELPGAVNAVRTAAGLSPFNATEAQPQSRGATRASYYNDLRANPTEAPGKLGLPVPQSALAAKNDAVTYRPVQELRDLIR